MASGPGATAGVRLRQREWRTPRSGADSSSSGHFGGDAWRELNDPDVVPEWITDPDVRAVLTFHGLLGELHAFCRELLERRLGVAGCEADREAGGALGDQFTDLLRRGVVDGRDAGHLQQDLPAYIAWDTDGPPAHEAEV